MKVLMTGATGFLGRYVLACLDWHGIDTVVVGRRWIPETSTVRFIESDLIDAPDMPTLVRNASATHLLHLAWYAEHGKFWTSPLNLRWMEATTRLVEAFCDAGGQKVVVAGTCAEYDWSYGYCREDSTPLNPDTLYGAVKDATRRLVMAICVQHNIPCAWGRIFIPYGTGEADQRLIPSLIDVFRGKRSPFGVNISAYRDFLHASDVAAAFVTLLRQNAQGAYNISSGQPVRLEMLIGELAQLMAVDSAPLLDLAVERPGEPPLLAGENLRLSQLGWRPACSLTQGLQRTLQGMRRC